MSLNKIKFTFLNLNNILKLGNEELIEFETKQYTLKNHKVTVKNKLFMDDKGLLYVEKDGSKHYGISKLKYGLMPHFCPECSRLMGKKQFDNFFWNIHKRCYDCAMKLLFQMQKDGTYDAYVLRYMRNKLIDTCNEAIVFYTLARNQNSRSLVINELGDTETWDMTDKQTFNDTIDRVINEIVLYRDEAKAYFLERLNNVKGKSLQSLDNGRELQISLLEVDNISSSDIDVLSSGNA